VLNQVHFVAAHDLVDLVSFCHTLPSVLAANPKIKLLIFSTLSFLFHKQPTPAERARILEIVKQSLIRAIAGRKTAVIVTTQMSTKFVTQDGERATFDNAATVTLAPQLGTSWLPASKSYQIVLVRDSKDTGYAMMFSSPTSKMTKGHRKKEPYRVDSDGFMVDPS